MKYLIFVLFFIVASGIALMLINKPRTYRQWDEAFSRAPFFTEFKKDQWRLEDLRAFAFDEKGRVYPEWQTVDVDPAGLTEIWFFVEPFEAWDGAAHTFLSFVFDGDTPQTLSISVEARREEGETYSGFRGLFGAYELINVWSTEKDVLTRIAVGLDHEIYAYRLSITPAQAQAILKHFIHRTNALRERPRFYNTLASNCTNELSKAVNDAFPGALPHHYANWLTGYSDERLHALGYLGTPDATFTDVNSKANAQDSIKAAREVPADAFPEAWRTHFQRQDGVDNKTVSGR